MCEHNPGQIERGGGRRVPVHAGEKKNTPPRAYLRQFYQGNKLRYAAAAVGTIMVGGANLIISGVLKELIDTISGAEGALPLRTLLPATIGAVLLIIAIELLLYHTRPVFLERAMLQYKNFVFEKLTGKSIASFHDETTAAYISALSNDVSSIETNYLANQFDLVGQLVTACGAVMMMLIYSPLLTLIAFLFSILPVVASLLTGNRLAAAERRVSDRNESFIATVADGLNGFSVIKSFQAEKAILKLFEKSNAALEDAKCRRGKVACAIGTVGTVAGSAAQLGVFLAGGYLALSGRGVTAGMTLAFLNLMNFVIQPIGEVPGILANRRAARALIKKLADALEANVRDTGRDVPRRLDTGISVNGLSFAYAGGKEVLSGIDARFDAGKCYAIVGASGSGKSTLLNLLMAAYDGYRGSIRYDENELRDISSRSLYELVSVIQQNVFVFNASIRDNITMFQDFPREELDRVIRLSGLSELIAQRGEDALCGENGNTLSGGQKQRISIARSLLRKSPVLLADEATAALDAQTAYQVTNSILGLEGLTRIVVTHSLDEALLKRYDGILALKSGRVVEAGGFDELMARRGYFYSLYTVSQ